MKVRFDNIHVFKIDDVPVTVGMFLQLEVGDLIDDACKFYGDDVGYLGQVENIEIKDPSFNGKWIPSWTVYEYKGMVYRTPSSTHYWERWKEMERDIKAFEEAGQGSMTDEEYEGWAADNRINIAVAEDLEITFNALSKVEQTLPQLLLMA